MPTQPLVFRPFVYATVAEYYRKQEEKLAELDEIKFRKDDLVCEEVEPEESVGVKRFRLFEETLENGFGSVWRREKVQREYHELCSNALASLILGDDWGKDGPELCAP